MAHKTLDIATVGQVQIYKRKGTKSIRLRVASDGSVRMTIPYWTPYAFAVDFAKKKASWIQAQKPSVAILGHQDPIGTRHVIEFTYGPAGTQPRTHVRSDVIKLYLSLGADYKSKHIQELLRAAAVRALKKEAQAYLPQRVSHLAREHGFIYRNVAIKRMKSRWGSCSSQKDISLNLYLMQLDTELIDYVILHELLHTKILAHGKRFWSELATYVPNLPEMRKIMKEQDAVIAPRMFEQN